MPKRYVLPDLPYKNDALEPTISKEIMKFHHDKHHLGYVNGANAALEKLEKARKEGFTGFDVKATVRDLSFNASGHVLHSIFWTNMRPSGGGKPGGALADSIDEDFGGFDAFKQQLSIAAKTVEASGWGVLAYDPVLNQLMVIQAEKHQDLAVQGATPILVIDVWEHAYYLQYKNDRGAFVDNWWNVANWDDADRRLEKVKR
ncbi:MAG: superoxide dismutase [Nitrososphaerales archaeon]|nr:superoxide dismutase [Nitrososphaerales archaeon]